MWTLRAPFLDRFLAAAGVLAAFHGVRFYLEVPWLDIAWIRALHGTADALGFGVAGLTGWMAFSRSRARRRLRGGLP